MKMPSRPAFDDLDDLPGPPKPTDYRVGFLAVVAAFLLVTNVLTVRVLHIERDALEASTAQVSALTEAQTEGAWALEHCEAAPLPEP